MITNITSFTKRHVAITWCVVLLVAGTIIWSLPDPGILLAIFGVFGGMALLGGFIAGIVALVQHRGP